MSRGKTVSLLIGALGLMLVLGACSKEEGLKITRIEPKEGSVNGGDLVTIYGSGFAEGGTKSVDVYFGKKKAKVRSIDGNDKLKVETPGGVKDQQVDIMLIFGDARKAKFPGGFKYIESREGYGVDELTGAGNEEDEGDEGGENK